MSGSGALVGQVVGVLTAGATLSFVISLVTVRASKRKILSEAGRTDADAAEKIKKSALDLVAEMERDAKDARTEVRALRGEVRALEEQLTKAITEGTAAVHELQRLRMAILDPAATVAALKTLVGLGGRQPPTRHPGGVDA